MFSFTPDIVDGSRTPQQILTDAVAADVADGVGLDGFQHFSTFPDISPDEVADFRSDIERLGIFLTELGLYDDAFADPTRRATREQRAEYLARQIRSAALLGFSAVKLGWGTDFALLDALLPVLDETGLTMLEEAQGPLRAGDDDYARRIEYAARHPDRFGFVFDLSAAMRAVPPTLIAELRSLNIPDEVVRIIDEEWPDDRAGGVKTHVAELTRHLDLNADARMRLMTPFTRFGNAHVSEFRDLFDAVRGVHAKYWDLDDENSALSDSIRELSAELDRAGYKGPITSEWGGHGWLKPATHDSIATAKAHRTLYRTAVASA